MHRFAIARAPERAIFFRECAERRGLASPVVVEKDFWVCWTLDSLFRLDESPHLMFKGGTSLSKGYGLIERFSEDIDIAIERSVLDLPEEFDVGALEGTKERQRALDQLRCAAEEFVAETLLPRLRDSGETDLPGADLFELDPTDPQTILVSYPPALERDDYGGLPYIMPTVRIEMGARSDHHSVEEVIVRSYTAQDFPDEFERPACPVRTQSPIRTFWEKATILHAENNRPPREDAPRAWIRGSRHPSDLVMMDRGGMSKPALENLELLAQVAQHKAIYFRSNWAKYDEARPGTLRLVPSGAYLDSMRRDYSEMEPMFFGERLSFEEMMQGLEALEQTVNTID